MKGLSRLINWLASLKVAIVLFILIAIGSAIGTAIPQNEPSSIYLSKFATNKFLGLINGDLLIDLQLDHVYSSFWFLGLIFWLSISLIVCSWRRQWPTLKKAIAWVDYKDPKQIQRLVISQTFKVNKPSNNISKVENYLINYGWQVKKNSSRLAARKGVIGRVGPPLVHLGLILLMFGATFGALKGERLEKFLAPDRSLSLLSPDGINKINLKLNQFEIDRGPNGEAEQFRSNLIISNNINEKIYKKEISVNHPLRFQGITIYQADWSLAAITIQIDNSPKLQLPLQKIDELGQQVWGVLVPTIDKTFEPFLLTLSNEQGPIAIFNQQGNSIGVTRPGGDSIPIGEKKLKIINVLPSSGILIKHDPGVPIVYLGFSITLIGSILSIISTKQLWIIAEEDNNIVHIGGLSNRNLSGFATQFPSILKVIVTS